MEYALQLYSLRDDTKVNYAEAIKKVGEMGYTAVELCGSYGETAQGFKRLLDEAGLKAVSTHEGLNRLLNNADEVMEFNSYLGNKNIVLPYYGFPSLEEAKKSVDIIGGIKEKFTSAGFEFGYHNHAHEFKPLDGNGACAMDFLHQIDGLKFQPDVFWVKTAGLDPVAFIKANAGRLISVHMKEYREDGFNVELGNGILPWKEIMAEANKGGAALGIVEQEEYTCPPMESVKICVDNLKKIFG